MSTVPAVRAALISVLGAALADDVQIIDGGGATTLGTKVVFIGKVSGQRSAGSQNRIRTTTRNIPFGTHQDEYTVDIIISVALAGAGETTTALTLADEIFEAARNAIEASDDLSVAGVHEALPSGDFEFDPTADANGRYCTVSFGVDVTARD